MKADEPEELPAYADVVAAHERIAPYIQHTPVLSSATLDERVGAELFFKCESFQKTGSFKARGACNAVFALDEAAAQRGVVTHSSGNHGQALAYAAARRGIACTVVMPDTAPEAKRAAVLGYGARVVSCAASTSAREAAVSEVTAATGAVMIHPYNDARVIAGQGTCAVELLGDLGGLDAIVAPVGGGGLIGGTGLVCAAVAPYTAVIAAEPEAADDASRSLATGTLVAYDAPRTVADGLKVPLGSLTWPIFRRHVREVLLVGENEIVAAMRLVWQRMKIVIEPSSAVAVAAILKHAGRFEGLRVGVIVTGGNVDLDRLPWQS